MDYNIRFNLAKTAALVVRAAIVRFATCAVVASRASRDAKGSRTVSRDEGSPRALHGGPIRPGNVLPITFPAVPPVYSPSLSGQTSGDGSLNLS